MSATRAGLVQSIVIKAQRKMLDEIGLTLGTPVVYLKAAWADPVLYGGRGERMGTDVDVLVRPAAFAAFARALAARGFHLYGDWGPATMRWRLHAWTYMSERWLAVDLHRRLADPPWFRVPTEELLDRAVSYDSVDGPLLSLGPEDQVIYAAAHYATNRFGQDQRHLNDVFLLLTRQPIDWDAVVDRARHYGLELPLILVAEALLARGAPVPPMAVPRGWLSALSLRWLRTWIATAPELRRVQHHSRLYDKLVNMPLLTGRLSTLPRYVARYGAIRVLDAMAYLVRRVRASG